MNAKLNIVCRGIKVKLNRGEELKEILKSYVYLTEKEKTQILEYFELQ